MNESEVYYYAKQHLRAGGLKVFGGEPPGGSDDLHRIELKHPDQVSIGSKGSRKFDLLAEFNGRILLIELKDAVSKLATDIAKLDDTVASEAWIGKLWDNLTERRLLGRLLPPYKRHEMTDLRHELFVKVVGAPPAPFVPPPNFIFLAVSRTGVAVSSSTFQPEGFPDELRQALQTA